MFSSIILSSTIGTYVDARIKAVKYLHPGQANPAYDAPYRHMLTLCTSAKLSRPQWIQVVK